ncbi:MAG: hypothetical protein ACREI8_11185, partial [Myxococcota bacterium]
MDRDPILLENNVSPESPLAELATLVAGIALIGLALFLVVWLAAEGVVRWLPASLEERAFGASWSGAVAAEDGARVGELDALLHRLARHWPGHGYALHIAVTDAPEPNAFALPGG